ncbi:MAG: hypothetical protein ABJB11_13730 [Ferruginibacter sp.]
MGTGKKAKGAISKTKDQQNKALSKEWQQIAYYFELLDKEGPAEDCWKMLKLALVADNDKTNARDRSNMLFFYEYTKQLFENVYTLLCRCWSY